MNKINKMHKINTILIISSAISTLANIALVSHKITLYGAAFHFAAFFAGFNLHFACFLMRHWLRIAFFGAIRAWFLAGYLVMFSPYLALILLGNDIICLYLRVVWIKPQIKPPGC